jgi:hypothetical protein
MNTIVSMAGRSFAPNILHTPYFLPQFLSHLYDFLWIKWHVKRQHACACLRQGSYPNWNPAAQNPLRTVVESPLFTAQRATLGNAQQVDEALRRIGCTLAACPEHYPIVCGTQPFRLAPTQYVEGPGGIIQALRIWYTIEPDDTVLLQAIDQLE